MAIHANACVCPYPSCKRAHMNFIWFARACVLKLMYSVRHRVNVASASSSVIPYTHCRITKCKSMLFRNYVACRLSFSLRFIQQVVVVCISKNIFKKMPFLLTYTMLAGSHCINIKKIYSRNPYTHTNKTNGAEKCRPHLLTSDAFVSVERTRAKEKKTRVKYEWSRKDRNKYNRPEVVAESYSNKADANR